MDEQTHPDSESAPQSAVRKILARAGEILDPRKVNLATLDPRDVDGMCHLDVLLSATQILIGDGENLALHNDALEAAHKASKRALGLERQEHAKTREQLQRTAALLEGARRDQAEKLAALRAADEERATRRIEQAAATASEQARAVERSAVARELAELRGVTAAQQTEIAELRASKKKLREAVERARGAPGHVVR